jgi:hypothetical protein
MALSAQGAIRDLGGYMGQGRDIMTNMATSSLSGAVNLFGELSGKIRGVSRATQEWAESLEQITSVNQMMGVETSPFNADLYSRASDALRDANLEAEQYAEAQQLLGLELGTTNAANELFNQHLDKAAQALEEGRINAMQYVQEVRALKEMDWSGITWLSERMGTEDQNRMIDVLGSEKGAEAWNTLTTGIKGLVSGEGEEGGGVFDPIMNEADNLRTHFEETTKQMTDEAMETWSSIQTTGSDSFNTLRSDAVTDLGIIKEKIDAFKGYSFVFTVNSSVMGSPVRSGGAPAGAVRTYHNGGVTPSTPGEYPAILRENEAVIPLDTMASGGNSNPVTVEIDAKAFAREFAYAMRMYEKM